jgi:sigma-B regulation protein RsbU (phosphoserine phosphatase)
VPAPQRPSDRAAEVELVRILAEAATIEDAGERVLHLLAERFDWTAGTLWLADDDERLLRWAQDWGRDEPEISAFLALTRRLTFAPGAGVVGDVWSSGTPVWVEAIDDDGRFLRGEAAARADLRSAVALPVIAPTGVIGVLEFVSRSHRRPEADVMDLLGVVGRQVGQYVGRWQAERRLQTVQERATAVMNAALDCIVSIDEHGVVMDFNPASEETFGYTRAEAVGTELAQLIIPPDLRDAHRAALARHLATGEARILNQRLELMGMRADGSTFPVELTVTRIGEPGRAAPMFAGFVRDITERRRSRDELARLLEREHETARTLQRALLPESLPDIPGHDLAVRYVAGTQGSVAGGDWYDAFALPDGRYGMVIGDVVGRGIPAAATMGRLRNALRAYAIDGAAPDEVVARVHRLTDAVEDVSFATFLYLLLDAASGEARYAAAGHPPPLVVPARGEAAYASLRPGPPLGAPALVGWPEERLVLVAGSTLILYTDGLVEAPGRPIGDGLAQLARAAEARSGGVEALTDRILSHLAADRGWPDDIALLTLRSRRDGV